MKKLTLLSISILLITNSLTAQVLYPTQPKEGYYEMLKQMVLAVVPTENQLINAKNSALPAGFRDTLLKYDWYEIASYHVYEKSYRTDFGADLAEREAKYANNQFNFRRYTPAGIIYEMNLQRYKNATLEVYTTTFDENTAVKLVEVKKSGTKNMMVTSAYGETEMQEIVSYSKGLMIMKLRETPNNNIKMFIVAYMAVPKTF